MKRIVLIIALIVLMLVSCVDIGIERTEAPKYIGSGIYRIHDDELSVTCWRYTGVKAGGLSCIPDWMLEEPNN
jgi:hypothetical protein